jgi:beta-carotene 3-hydroxylase
MAFWLGFILFCATVLAMEGVAYVSHRWIMHGPGWFLHKSHHQAPAGWWELNDAYFILYAIPSAALLVGGLSGTWHPWTIWVGAGIAAYGAIYLIFHDVIVHRRVNTGYVPRSSYMKRIVQAHRLHHVVETKDDTVSFGFLIAPRPELLKASLKASLAARNHSGLRAPRGVSSVLDNETEQVRV